MNVRMCGSRLSFEVEMEMESTRVNNRRNQDMSMQVDKY